jgi:hypothetical protein
MFSNRARELPTNFRKLVGRCLVERFLTLFLRKSLEHGESVGRHIHVHGLLDVIYDGPRAAIEAKVLSHHFDRSNKQFLSLLRSERWWPVDKGLF